jgi:hypothetical protein
MTILSQSKLLRERMVFFFMTRVPNDGGREAAMNGDQFTGFIFILLGLFLCATGIGLPFGLFFLLIGYWIYNSGKDKQK